MSCIEATAKVYVILDHPPYLASCLRFRMMGGEAKQNSVFKTMILFSLAMLSVPVFLYFFSKSIFFEGECSTVMNIMAQFLDRVIDRHSHTNLPLARIFIYMNYIDTEASKKF